jgi:uncharacterized protein (UPF0332 family)
MNDTPSSIIQYRINRAEETLKEAHFMLENKMYFGAANRLYYACFYSVIALLLSEGFSAKTHKGVRNLFHLQIIEKGLLPREYSHFFSELFNYRQENDYDDYFTANEEIMPQWLDEAEQFIRAAKGYIDSKANL